MNSSPYGCNQQNRHSFWRAWQILGLGIVVSLDFLFVACSIQPAQIAPDLLATIPAQADWVDCGTIFAAGAEGEWDRYLWGGFANGVVKRNGTYYLYYQGATDYDEDEGTVTWRAIGVATSTDGITFTKYPHNPVLSWFPSNHLEEGAVSGGVFVDVNGEIAVYYGANTWAGDSSVSADGRLATSSDGFSFTDRGVVLDHTDDAIWGSGDELFPIIALQETGRWVSYYIPNGTLQRGNLGVAWGTDRHSLANSSAAQEGSRMIPVWGSGSAVQLGEGVYALFLNNVRDADGPATEARGVSLSRPNNLSVPLHIYRFAEVHQAVVFRDGETNTWFMYYRSADHTYYGVKVVPANGQAPTCSMHRVHLPLLSQDVGMTVPVALSGRNATS